jgi:hypothetical protein
LIGFVLKCSFQSSVLACASVIFPKYEGGRTTQFVSSPSPMAACKILAKVSLLLRYLVMTCLIPPVGVTKAISQ